MTTDQAFKGSNILKLSHETMLLAVETYFATVFRKPPVAVSIAVEGDKYSGTYFSIECEEAKAEELL